MATEPDANEQDDPIVAEVRAAPREGGGRGRAPHPTYFNPPLLRPLHRPS
jgi:hypothetical protein